MVLGMAGVGKRSKQKKKHREEDSRLQEKNAVDPFTPKGYSVRLCALHMHHLRTPVCLVSGRRGVLELA